MVRTYGNIESNRRILDLEKVFHDDIVMVNIGNNSSFISAPIYNKVAGESIVGLGINFRAKRMTGYVKYNFGLTLRSGRELHWIVDLCIYPNHVVSHADRAKRTEILGSHIHLLGDTNKIDVDFETKTWQDYFEIFKKHSKIEFSSSVLIAPFEGELI